MVKLRKNTDSDYDGGVCHRTNAISEPLCCVGTRKHISGTVEGNHDTCGEYHKNFRYFFILVKTVSKNAVKLVNSIYNNRNI